ncbi:hypothetical protein PHLCEN_2v6345 [Hermanssonia centrifuga]|uniref:Uncharacterized protein n=1 Tax=Hermanssonia centrifuga TaxID=98765 RepID=A0A2R6NZT1_9APHY|nr:hypothetical protein PHLCEN_2v6345 [Hermanssonia centrifuga]
MEDYLTVEMWLLHSLMTSFFYTPLTRAEPPSALRQASYINGHPIIGPDGDPEGWKVLPTVQIAGTLFNTRSVSVECTLSFSTGSPIPMFVTCTSSDEQALDLVCAPSAMRFHLYRERLIGSHATREGAAGQSNNTFREVMCTAAFWPSQESAPEPGKRTLQGELDVKKGMRPTFTFPRFTLRVSVPCCLRDSCSQMTLLDVSVHGGVIPLFSWALQYVLCMFPFEAPGFVPANPDVPLFTERVMVHTLNAVGIIPRSFAPPGYAGSMEGNYNNVAGYLENGNQR